MKTPINELLIKWRHEADTWQKYLDEHRDLIPEKVYSSIESEIAQITTKAAELEAAIAVADTAAAEQQWQPIETAPKDGTPILAVSEAHIKEGWSPQVIEWSDVWMYSECFDEFMFEPTHWMPIPAAPTPPKP